MKTATSLFLLGSAIFFAACGNNNTSTQSAVKTTTEKSQAANTDTGPKKAGAVDGIISGYLNLKNALAKDNGSEAAGAAKQISTALVNVDEAALNPEQKKVYNDVKDDIKEHAEHIASNSAHIAHQREHFDILSQDVIDLVKAAGTRQTLYNDFCPMYNNKKGAHWLSETKDIKNPYYGKEMSDCGEVKEEIKPGA